MRRLPFIICLLFSLVYSNYAQSPHGPDLKIDCAVCHSPQSWKFDVLKASFTHDSTNFSLKGQHAALDCRSCHANPDFKKVPNQCNICHTDVHQQTVGISCDRCHSAESWIVSNILDLHDRAQFPLRGVHNIADCQSCHPSATTVDFKPLGLRCIDCHRSDYNETTNPDHKKNNFSTECLDCHNLEEKDWKTSNIKHDFFPLEKGHDIRDCASCHKEPDFSKTSNECYSCHQRDFENSLNPPHKSIGFSNQCASCHTIDPDWRPANYVAHDQFFGIYSGGHKGHWQKCNDCHQNPADYQQVNCLSCHIKTETDEDHKNINNYVYQNNACLACHPNGDKTNIFDHNTTAFPLTGAHQQTACLACHQNGFKGTSTDCYACHRLDYESSANPQHKKLNFSQQCIQCHTTNADWKPARLEDHDRYFVLDGAHKNIANDCASCHKGNYNNTPNTCFACHADDYTNATDPNHRAAQFPTECTSCHNTGAWIPSNFDHDGNFFPINSGKHKGQWNQCVDCHQNPNNYKEFNCLTCHINPETDQQHQGVFGYVYQNNACLACHPSGDADIIFSHDATSFPLTGAHRQVNCLDCHPKIFKGTSSDCVTCHQNDFDLSLNPDHKKLNLGRDCNACHTTDAGWMPARFDIHNQIYAIEGAHVRIANDCKVCHNGNYNNTPNTCVGCHAQDYTNSKDPDHIVAKFPNDCASCHSQSAWQPSTFNHDGLHFPIYIGKHKNEWTQCVDCHKDPGNFSQFTCTSCHLNPETDNVHVNINGYIYNDQACFACHPTGDADFKFDHNATSFPLAGAHAQASCIECHKNGYKNTPQECIACHQMDFNQTKNPDHAKIQSGTECTSCHTTDPGWKPARFDIHDQFYPLIDAHAKIRTDCAACHNGNYNNTPNTCVGCHLDDYNNTSNPNHRQVQFPDDCAACHNQKAWEPSTFDHDGMYFPVYSGKHKNQWNACMDCHTNANDFKQFSCITCHTNPQTNDEHQGVPGYFYENNACFACHPTGDADFKFDHNSTSFPLTGAHVNTNCIECHRNVFKGTSSDCISCHQNDFDQSQNPKHRDLNLSTDCIQCHTTNPDWSPAKFNIHDQFFVLDGAHSEISMDCNACHKGNYNITPNTCVGCHQNDYNNAQDPNHNQLQIPDNCVNCHSTARGWQPASFDIHDNYYVLQGAHKLISNECFTCHKGSYNNTPNTCVGCHLEQYQNTSNPDHEVAQFPTDCATCHSESAWTPSTFNHDGMYFPIYSGTHKPHWNECMDCHTNSTDFKIFTCISCHVNPETNDQHIGVGGYFYESYACLACHPTGEKKMAFDHNISNFPLTGAHRTTDCLECHKTGFKGTPTECSACHLEHYNQSANPNHLQLNLSKDCAACHTTDPGWAPARFDIHDNFWVINGAHELIRNDCNKCHSGDYNNTPNTCNGCHLNDYNQSRNPNHRQLQFPTDCESCHTTQAGWAPASFAIHNNYWVIDGAHEPIRNDCFTCHKGDYNNTPNTCNGCHANDFNNSTNPNHTRLNLSRDCATCHSTQPGWAPASFNIHNNYYVLLGAHLVIKDDCFACHKGNYNNTPNTCYGCHRPDYEGTSNPDHESAQFPTDCASCHSQSSWTPSSFDHDNMYFPIYSGKHEGQWNRCSDCHNNPNNYSIFNCLGCHPKPQTDSEHQGVSGYSYNSNACFQCHPDGEE